MFRFSCWIVLLFVFLAALPVQGQIYLEEGEGIENSFLTDDELIFDVDATAFENWFFQRYIFDAPANDIYEIWDTLRIHPYGNDPSKINDTIYVPLVDKLIGQYFVPPRIDVVTSDFGFRRHRYHYGIDIDCDTGDPIYVAFDGKVRITANSKSYGKVVVVRHYNGLETIYAHLSKINVKTNEDVKAGDVLGLGGNTGRSRGSHLHLEFRYLGIPINPNAIVCFKENVLKSDTLALTKESFKHIVDARAARYHVVRKGDTLGKIARTYGTTVNHICQLNRITTRTTLQVGRRLRVS